jgi:hypothetical protein
MPNIIFNTKVDMAFDNIQCYAIVKEFGKLSKNVYLALEVDKNELQMQCYIGRPNFSLVNLY